MPDFSRWKSSGGDPSLNEINRTDRFLDSLATDQPVYATDHSEAELAQLLAGWRDDVRQTPVKTALSHQEAAAALQRTLGSRHRTRLAMRAVGSVAAAMLCLGGFGAAVYGSSPGDALYGLRSSLFGAPQVHRDDQVVLAAQSQLAEVQQLIDQGDWSGAQNKLETLTTTVATVDDMQRKQQLANQWQQLSAKVDSRDPNATVPPGAPPMPVPSDLPSDTSTSTSAPSSTTSPTSPSDMTPPTLPTSPTAPSEVLPGYPTGPLPGPSTPPTSVPWTTPSPTSSPSTLPSESTPTSPTDPWGTSTHTSTNPSWPSSTGPSVPSGTSGAPETPWLPGVVTSPSGPDGSYPGSGTTHGRSSTGDTGGGMGQLPSGGSGGPEMPSVPTPGIQAPQVPGSGNGSGGGSQR